MSSSIFEVQRAAILKAIRHAGRGQWRVLVLDETSRRLVFNVLKEDDILAEHITNIEQIEERRQRNTEYEATYLLTPEPHIVDCVLADLEKRRYCGAALLWTSMLHRKQMEQLNGSRSAAEWIKVNQALDVYFWPKESHLITLKDPWSFLTLFHPGCNHLVADHLKELARKVVAVCVSLGEYPTIRYYQPPTATHEAAVLCTHLARFVQNEIDFYAHHHQDFPPPSSRPRATIYILDRSMDLVAPLLHEFTYQAMIYDLLPIKDSGDKASFKMTVNEGQPGQELKDVPISEKDTVWVSNRHRHMKDTIDKLMGDFQRFLDENPHFANSTPDNANSLSAIRDMLVGLPQFQELKEAYSLHLTMAQDAMNAFQKRKLPELASVEQTLATGFDEEHKKAKGMADLLVRTLDEESVVPPDRLRLILLYMLYRAGLLPSDLNRLLAHAQLPPQDGDIARNLGNLGAHVTRQLKDPRPLAQPLFPIKPSPLNPQEEYSLSRFETNLQRILEEHCRGTLDQELFPYTKPTLDPMSPVEGNAQVSLRSGKSTWASSKQTSTVPKQRIIVFMAGGATYSESRACYEMSQKHNKEVFLVTSHMLTPSLFIQQLRDLSVDHRRLNIPAERPRQKAPAHLFEDEKPPPPKPAPSGQRPPGAAPPTAQMANMAIGNGQGTAAFHNGTLTPTGTASAASSRPNSSTGMPKETEKKKRGLKIFGKKG